MAESLPGRPLDDKVPWPSCAADTHGDRGSFALSVSLRDASAVNARRSAPASPQPLAATLSSAARAPVRAASVSVMTAVGTSAR